MPKRRDEGIEPKGPINPLTKPEHSGMDEFDITKAKGFWRGRKARKGNYDTDWRDYIPFAGAGIGETQMTQMVGALTGAEGNAETVVESLKNIVEQDLGKSVSTPEGTQALESLVRYVMGETKKRLTKDSPDVPFDKKAEAFLAKKYGGSADPSVVSPLVGMDKKTVEAKLNLHRAFQISVREAETKVQARKEREQQVVTVVSALVSKDALELELDPAEMVSVENGQLRITDSDVESRFQERAGRIEKRVKEAIGGSYKGNQETIVASNLGLPVTSVVARGRYDDLDEQIKLLALISDGGLKENRSLAKSPKEKQAAKDLEDQVKQRREAQHALELQRAELTAAEVSRQRAFIEEGRKAATEVAPAVVEREDFRKAAAEAMIGKGVSGGPGFGAAAGQEAAAGNLEALTSHEGFRNLQETVQGIRRSLGDIGAVEFRDELRNRGMLANGYLSSELILFAALSREELQMVDPKGDIVDHLSRSIPKDKAKSARLIRSTLNQANMTMDMLDTVIVRVGSPVDDVKMQALLTEANAEQPDSDRGRVIRMLAGQLNQEGGLGILIGLGKSGGGKISDDPEYIDLGTAYMKKIYADVIATLRQTTPVSSTSGRSKESVSSPGEKLPSPKETLDWLSQNRELFGKLEAFIASDDWLKLLKDFKGYDLLENLDDLERFADLHFLGNFNELKGVLVYNDLSDRSSRYSMESLSGKIEARHLPVRALLKLMMWKRQNPKAEIPEDILKPVQEYKALVDKRVVNRTAESEQAPDILLRALLTGLKYVEVVAKIMQKEGINPKDPKQMTYDRAVELVKQLGESLPENRANLKVLIPLFMGLPMDEQLTERLREGMPSRSVRGMAVFPNANLDFPALLTDMLQETLPQREEGIELLQRSLTEDEETPDIFAA